MLERLRRHLNGSGGPAGSLARGPEPKSSLPQALALDREQLSPLQRGLHQRLRRSPLLDEKGFTRALEALYGDAWQGWCAERP